MDPAPSASLAGTPGAPAGRAHSLGRRGPTALPWRGYPVSAARRANHVFRRQLGEPRARRYAMADIACPSKRTADPRQRPVLAATTGQPRDRRAPGASTAAHWPGDSPLAVI